MIEGMEAYVGRKLNQKAMERYAMDIRAEHAIFTCPNFYRGDCTHINMIIKINDEMRIADFFGNKCYSAPTGMYNLHPNVYHRNFTKSDIAYLRKFVIRITEKEEGE